MADTKKGDSTASESQNAKLEHPEGGITTREDALDAGVPMLPGDRSERQGPEDALGRGPKRGDYTQRVGPSDYHPHQSVPVENPEPDGPTARLEAQRPRAEDIGDAKGLKGGVETDPLNQ
jgi:hypothetical protein